MPRIMPRCLASCLAASHRASHASLPRTVVKLLACCQLQGLKLILHIPPVFFKVNFHICQNLVKKWGGGRWGCRSPKYSHSIDSFSFPLGLSASLHAGNCLDQARSWLSISGGALQKECNRGVGMILTFVLAASFPFQLRKIGIERNVLLHRKSIILVLNFVISLSYFSIELTLYLDRLIYILDLEIGFSK